MTSQVQSAEPHDTARDVMARTSRNRRSALIGGGVVLILAVLVLAVTVFFSSLNSIVRAAVEQVGSEVTGTEVTLDEVEISLTDGRASLFGFEMTNPAGFEADAAFVFDEVTVVLDPTTVASDPIVIEEISVFAPVITYELAAEGSNMEAIRDNVGRYDSAAASSSDEGSGEGPKIVIKHLYLKDGTVHVLASRFTDETLTADLPDIHLRNIGEDGKGVTPAEAAKQVMAGLLPRLTRAISKIDISSVTDAVSASLKGVEETVKERLSGAGSAVDDLAKEGSKALKGLLGN